MTGRGAIVDRVREWGLREDIVEKDFALGWVRLRRQTAVFTVEVASTYRNEGRPKCCWFLFD
ncbi:MAG: hypothetical protein Q7O66_11345 [Dehalococcoidia bacterium]|nr:hypothetical protein [Dehalococcoidia bacterium]